MHNYSSSPDKLTKIITYVVVAIMILPPVLGYSTFLKAGKDQVAMFGLFIGPVIIFVLMIAMYLLSPLSVEITNTGLIIHRKIYSRNILFKDIESIRMAEPDEMNGTIRTFGNGGLFGYTGMYWNKKLGSMRWYCSQRKNYILIDKEGNKRIVITPDDPDDFIKDVRQFIPDNPKK